MAIENITSFPPQGEVVVEGTWIRIATSINDEDAATFLKSQPSDQFRVETVDSALRLGLRTLASADHSYTERLLDQKLDNLVGQLGQAAEVTLAKASAAFEDKWAKRVDEDLSRRLDAHGEAMDGRLETLFGDGSDRSVQERVKRFLVDYHAKVKLEIEEDRSRLRREMTSLINGAGNPDHPLAKINAQLADLRKELAVELEAARAATLAKGTRKASIIGGHDFQATTHAALAALLRGSDDEVELKGRSPGATGGADGDVVITVDPALTGGSAARIGVEVTQQAGLSLSKIKATLKKTKDDRAAQVAVVVIRDPMILGGQRVVPVAGLGVVAVFEPEDPEEYATLALNVAIKLAKAIAIREVRPTDEERDDDRIDSAVQRAKDALDAIDAILGNQTKIIKFAEGTTLSAKELRRTVADALKDIDEALSEG